MPPAIAAALAVMRHADRRRNCRDVSGVIARGVGNGIYAAIALARAFRTQKKCAIVSADRSFLHIIDGIAIAKPIVGLVADDGNERDFRRMIANVSGVHLSGYG